MKYQVQISYTNPAHEHVSLRRRVDTITRLVEASSESEALNRAANQQRALGFMIREAKVIQPDVLAEEVEQIDEIKLRNIIPGVGKQIAKSRSQSQRDQARLAGKEARADGLPEPKFAGDYPKNTPYHDVRRQRDRHHKTADRYDRIAQGKSPFAKKGVSEEVEQIDENAADVSQFYPAAWTLSPKPKLGNKYGWNDYHQVRHKGKLVGDIYQPEKGSWVATHHQSHVSSDRPGRSSGHNSAEEAMAQVKKYHLAHLDNIKKSMLTSRVNKTTAKLTKEEVEKVDEEGYYVMGKTQSVSWHKNKQEAEKEAARLNMRGGTNHTVKSAARTNGLKKEEVEQVAESIEKRIAYMKKNNPLHHSVKQHQDGYTALVTDKNTGKPSWFGGAIWRTPELAMGHAKAFIKGFPYLEQRHAERFVNKNLHGIVSTKDIRDKQSVAEAAKKRTAGYHAAKLMNTSKVGHTTWRKDIPDFNEEVEQIDEAEREAGYKMSPAVRKAQAESDKLSNEQPKHQAGTLPTHPARAKIIAAIRAKRKENLGKMGKTDKIGFNSEPVIHTAVPNEKKNA